MAWHLIEDSDPSVADQMARFIERASQIMGAPDGVPLVATGYGRGLVPQATRVATEIICHARGVYAELGHGGTLVDIGGQDSKAIRIGSQGQVTDFAMNDKCAAGTGRFLEYTASRLKVPLDQMGALALSETGEAAISSTCTVFAESEVVSLIAHGVPVPAILRGLHRSLTKRIASRVHMVGLEPPLMLSGGVVLNPAIRKMLEEETGQTAVLPDYPQLMGALGAALFALDVRHSRRPSSS